MSEIINFTRLTTSDKLPDKFVTCQAYIPQDQDHAQKGQIFSHLEISSPWFQAGQIGQTIINSLIKEYYRGNDSSDLINFEEAIKKVNESLAQTAQSGETDWIGKLSGVLVLINNCEIHFAQTGKSHSYLYRGGKVNHITEGLESEEPPHPLKTFSNLTSGTMQEADKIIIANNSFFEVISPNELKLIISSLPPALAAIESAKILQNHGTQDANAIFLELTNLEKLADLPPEHKIEAVYLDQQILTMTAMSRNLFSNLGRSAGHVLKRSASTASRFSKNIYPLAKKGFEKSKELAARSRSRNDEKKHEADYDESSSPAETLSESPAKKLFTIFSKTKNKVRRFLIQIGLYTRKKSKLYLSLLLAVLVILAGSIYFSYSRKQSLAKASELEKHYNRLIALSGEADVSFGTNQAEALSKYNKVISLADTLKKSKFSDETRKIEQKAKDKIQSVAKLSVIDAKSQTPLNDGSSIVIDDNKLYASAGGDLYSKDQYSSSLVKVAPLGNSISLLNYSQDQKKLFAISKNQLISFDISGNDLNNSDIVFKDVTALKSFGSNLYVTDQSANQLYKVSFADGSFKDKTDYFKETVDITQIVDFAIDGSVYTLSKDGSIVRFSRGSNVGDFRTTLPSQEKIERFVGLYTSESATNLLVLAKINNSYRLIELRKNGDFIKQIELKGVTDPKSITTDLTNTKIFVLSGNSILEYTLE